MATYHYFKQGYEIPFDNFGFAVLRNHLDVPAIIASGAVNYSPLAVGGVRTALPSTTGFVGAADVLQLFRVPAGFHIMTGGVRITTAGNATTTIDMGIVNAGQTANGAAAGLLLTTAVTSAAANLLFDAVAGTTIPATAIDVQDYFITDGTIDITFNTANQLTLICDIWVVGCKGF